MTEFKKSEQTKARIHEVAFRLFQEQGFRKTTIPQICEQANVSRSTFFHYFKSKADILIDHRESFADRLNEAAELLPDDMPGKEKVRTLLMLDVDNNLKDGGALRLAYICNIEQDPEFRAGHDRMWQVVAPMYARVLKKTYPDVDPSYLDDVGVLIVRFYRMIWLSCIFYRDDLDFKAELNKTLDMVWDGLGLA